MICAHCKSRDVTVSHVKSCSTMATNSSTESGAPTERIFVSKVRENHPREKVTEPGVYFDGELYFKVVANQSGTGLYAKVWNAGWEYAPGVLRELYADQRVTAEEAARFGKLWGSCVFCTKQLTDERSIAVGYGKICASHNGLPWGAA